MNVSFTPATEAVGSRMLALFNRSGDTVSSGYGAIELRNDLGARLMKHRRRSLATVGAFAFVLVGATALPALVSAQQQQGGGAALGGIGLTDTVTARARVK